MAPLDAVIQYIDWALIAAHGGAHPDCREVHVVVDLKNRSTRTSFVPKTAPEGYKDPRVLLNAMEAVFVALTGSPAALNRQQCAAFLRDRLKLFDDPTPPSKPTPTKTVTKKIAPKKPVPKTSARRRLKSRR